MKFEIDSDEELWIGEERLGKEDIQYLVNALYKKEFQQLKDEAEAKLDDLLYGMLNDVEVEETFNKILKKSSVATGLRQSPSEHPFGSVATGLRPAPSEQPFGSVATGLRQAPSEQPFGSVATGLRQAPSERFGYLFTPTPLEIAREEFMDYAELRESGNPFSQTPTGLTSGEKFSSGSGAKADAI